MLDRHLSMRNIFDVGNLNTKKRKQVKSLKEVEWLWKFVLTFFITNFPSLHN